MPKERRDRSVSSDRYRASPYRSSSSRAKCPSKISQEMEANIKEWEDSRCPVCMEHPHNAVLLLCTSHDKGCRPYMCDTSYRHSNCLDQFRKSFTASPPTSPTTPQREQSPLAEEVYMTDTPQVEQPLIDNETFPSLELDPPADVNLPQNISRQERTPPTSLSWPPDSTITELNEERVDGHATTPSDSPAEPKLLCPLCRGQIKEWIVVDNARRFMNAKSRSCASETCEFTGTYSDMRKHARLVHPLVRPTEADPERQRNWRRLERQRDLGDLLSTLQSSFEEERGEDSLLPMDERGWLTVFFLIRVFRPESGSRSRSWSGTSRARAQLSFRRNSTRLWGESYDGETISFSTEDDNDSSGEEASTWRRIGRTRRRTNPEDQS